MLSVCSRGLVLVVVLISLTVQMTHAESTWDQEMNNYTVEIHNDRRRNEGGCRIKKLYYYLTMEIAARNLSEKCGFEIPKSFKNGTNIGYSTKSREVSQKELVKEITDGWFNTKKTYTCGQASCEPSCSYTQMVWGETDVIGCHGNFCDSLAIPGSDKPVPNVWFLACVYAPRGNVKGKKIYEKNCTTPCTARMTEENGLCIYIA